MGFFIAKGLVSLVATALLLFHMRAVKRGPISLDRWLRYLSLLFFAVLVTGASIDQLTSAAEISWYNVGGLVGAALLILTVCVSITEDHRR